MELDAHIAHRRRPASTPRSRPCIATSRAARMPSLHFEVGRPLAERLGYPSALLDAIPAAALASFAGVGHHLDLAALRPGEAVLDLGSGSGTDAFCAAMLVGASGRVIGVDMTDEQVAKASRLRDGFPQVEFVEGADRGAAVRGRELRRRHLQRRDQPQPGEGPRLRRGGAGAAARRPAGPRRHRERASAQGAHTPQRRALGRLRRRRDPAQRLPGTRSPPTASESRRSGSNDYRFTSDRAIGACRTYAVKSISRARSQALKGVPMQPARRSTLPRPRRSRRRRRNSSTSPASTRAPASSSPTSSPWSTPRPARSCTRRRCRTSATSCITSAGTAAAPPATDPTART